MARSAAFVTIYLLLPNIPALLLEERKWLAPHGYINIECLIIGALAVFLPRSVTFLLLAFDMISCFICSICVTYQFSLAGLWDSLHSVSRLPALYITILIAALIVTLLFSFCASYLCPHPAHDLKKKTSLALILFSAVLLLFDTVNGHTSYWRKDSLRSVPRLSITPTVTLAHRAVFFRSVDLQRYNARDEHVLSASSKGIAILNPARKPDFVLVMVESWGLLEDQALADALTAGYQAPDIQTRYRVSQGTVPFDGPTLAGEGRELCQSRIGFGLLSISEPQGAACLPALLRSLGYRSISIHGYVGGMFERDHWHRKIGFEQSWFLNLLSRERLPICDGAFPGICDTSIPQWIGTRLLQRSGEQPVFVYWVTLNSHLPVPENPHVPDTGACSANPELRDSKSLCSWFRLVSALHLSVQNLALDTTRPTVFVLVGDHAPPFTSESVRQRFSASAVPYVILDPIGKEYSDRYLSTRQSTHSQIKSHDQFRRNSPNKSSSAGLRSGGNG